MKFTDFLYSNFTLDPAEGNEDTVYSMRAYQGPNGITAFASLTDEEIDLIVKTRGLWVHVSSTEWAPMFLSVPVPAFDSSLSMVQIYGDLARAWTAPDGYKNNGVVQYLDLSFLYLTIPTDQTLFIFKEVDPRDLEIPPDAIGLKNGDKIWDLTFIDAAKSRTERVGGRYLFSEALVVVGRLSELSRLHPFLDIHPFLDKDMLILMKKPTPPPPRILTVAK